jgi:hypothetical protein
LTGRLKPGINAVHAEGDLNRLRQQFAEEYPKRERLVENQAEAGPQEARLLPVGSLPPRTGRALGAFMRKVVLTANRMNGSRTPTS